MYTVNVKNSFHEKDQQEAGEMVCRLRPEAWVGAQASAEVGGGALQVEPRTCPRTQVWGSRGPACIESDAKALAEQGASGWTLASVATLPTTEAGLCYSEALSGRIYMSQRNLCSRKTTVWFLKCTWARFLDCPFSFHPFCHPSWDIFVSTYYVPGARLPQDRR